MRKLTHQEKSINMIKELLNEMILTEEEADELKELVEVRTLIYLEMTQEE